MYAVIVQLIYSVDGVTNKKAVAEPVKNSVTKKQILCRRGFFLHSGLWKYYKEINQKNVILCYVKVKSYYF